MNTPAPGRVPALGPGLRAYLDDVAGTVGKPRLLGLLLLVLICTALDSLGLLMVVPLLHLVNGSASHPAMHWLAGHGLQLQLGPMLLLFVGLVVARVGMTRRRDRSLLTLRLDYVDALRARMEFALAHASWPFLLRQRHTDVMHLLFDQLARVSQGTHQLMQALAGLGLAAASVIAALVLSPLWSLAIMVAVGLLGVVFGRGLAKVIALGGQFGRRQRDVLESARDFLGGLKIVKAHAAESQHLSEFSRRADRLRQEQLQFQAHQSRTRGGFEAGGAALLAALLYGATRWGRLDLPQLLLIVFLASRLLPLFREGHMQLQHLSHMLPAYQEIQRWIVQCRQHAEPAATTQAIALTLDRGLQFQGVGLCFDEAAAPSLTDVSLHLSPGSMTALVGPSGAGKTTLVDLLLGLLTPTSGQITLDGHTLSGDTLQRWRRSVAYVPQDAFLFPGSIRQNLCWLSGPQSDAALWEALEQADAADFVRALEHTLDHPLGERGEGLSGGQRQRLALARALLSRPLMLVLDEATSQLDRLSEQRIYAALERRRGHMMVVFIAHRLENAHHADRVLVIEHGQIVQDGSWATLSTCEGLFKRWLQ